MNRRFLQILLTSMTLTCTLFFAGCNKDSDTSTTTNTNIQETTISETTGTTTEASDTSEDTAIQNEEITETKNLIVSVLNFSNIDIGMFSVIDPVTSEQINVDSLESGNSLSIECNWPIDIKEFHWAMYNMNGELCIDATTDIENAMQSVTLAVGGDNTIDDFEVIIE